MLERDGTQRCVNHRRLETREGDNREEPGGCQEGGYRGGGGQVCPSVSLKIGENGGAAVASGMLVGGDDVSSSISSRGAERRGTERMGNAFGDFERNPTSIRNNFVEIVLSYANH